MHSYMTTIIYLVPIRHTMEAILDSKGLKAAFKAISTQVDSLKVMPDELGWRLYAMGTDKVSMVDARINLEAFEGEYEVWPEFCVDVDVFLSALAKAGEKTKVELGEGYLVITSGPLRMVRPLLADKDWFVRLPKAKNATEALLSVDDLMDVAAGLDKKGNYQRCRLKMFEDRLEMEVSEYQDPYTTTVVIPGEKMTLMGGNGNALYPLHHLLAMLSAVPKGTQVDLCFDTASILEVRFSVGHTDIYMVLCPQLEDEEVDGA